jgi:hypothetical protein
MNEHECAKTSTFAGLKKLKEGFVMKREQECGNCRQKACYGECVSREDT